MKQASLRWLLAVLGVLLEQAGRHSHSFRRQVTRDVVVEITTSDGVAHHDVFTCENKSVMSVRGPAEESTVSLWFADAGQAFWWLLSPHAVGHIVKATLKRRELSRAIRFSSCGSSGSPGSCSRSIGSGHCVDPCPITSSRPTRGVGSSVTSRGASGGEAGSGLGKRGCAEPQADDRARRRG